MDTRSSSSEAGIDAYDLFVGARVREAYPRGSVNMGSVRRLSSADGAELENRGATTVVVFSEFEPALSRGSGVRRINPRLLASGEHLLLGDDVKLEGLSASDGKLSLYNGLRLTYGEILMLAGDYFGLPDRPISGTTDYNERERRFVDAFHTLAQDEKALGQWGVLGTVPHAEAQELKNAVRAGSNPSDIYKRSEFGLKRDLFFNWCTEGRYLNLAAMNFDHFGDGAVVSYAIGHAAALSHAVRAGKGDPCCRLEIAYALNAFADHYLSDLFSAGHLRTPRVELHEWSSVKVPLTDIRCGDYLAKCMHDEDSHFGLNVSNNRSESWRAYGDMRFLNQESKRNREICAAAVAISAADVYRAYQSGADDRRLRALELAPTLSMAADWKSNPNNRDLFHFGEGKLWQRKNINNLGDHNYVLPLTCLDAAGLLAQGYNPPRWND